MIWAGHAKKCVDRYCELANKTTQQLYKVSTPCIDDHHFKEEMKSVGELSQVCSQIVLKCLYLARIRRPDIPRSVNKLARSITKWTKAWPGGITKKQAYSNKFVMSSDAAEFVNKVKDQVRNRQKRMSNVAESGEEHSIIW